MLRVASLSRRDVRKYCSGFRMRACIAVLVAAAALPSLLANAQIPVGVEAVFQSDSKSIHIERFDPKAPGLHPAVMLVHGGGGPGGEWRKGGILEALTTAGYSVFVPHYFDGGGEWTPSSNNPSQFIAYISNPEQCLPLYRPAIRDRQQGHWACGPFAGRIPGAGPGRGSGEPSSSGGFAGNQSGGRDVWRHAGFRRRAHDHYAAGAHLAWRR